MHHPKADIDRHYLPKISGGRGLEAYINNDADKLLGIIRDHDQVRNAKSLLQEATNFRIELSTLYIMIMLNESAIDYASRVKQKAKVRDLEKLQNKLAVMPLFPQ